MIFMQQLVGPKADAALLEPGGAVPTALAEIATFLFGGEGVPSTLMRCRVVGQREEFAQVCPIQVTSPFVHLSWCGWKLTNFSSAPMWR